MASKGGDDVPHRNVLAGGGGGDHIGPGLDLVRNDRVGAAAQGPAAVDADHVRPRALDGSADAVEEVGNIDHVGLLRGVGDDGLALRPDGGEHDVDRRADGNGVQINIRPAQAVFRLGFQDAPLQPVVAPRASMPLMCRSMGRTPIKQPPGRATSARPKRPSMEPSR